ncbi:hypothetical protein LCGC14_1577760 [marine sediment metagenome]|uniref:Uncharacterized protein n=1 Tax=marine sediment metagenome TaxID=412755 RepID=A0A0F9IHR9_9ZZZZ
MKAFRTTRQSLMEIAELIPSDEIATVAFSNLATLRGLLHSVRISYCAIRITHDASRLRDLAHSNLFH